MLHGNSNQQACCHVKPCCMYQTGKSQGNRTYAVIEPTVAPPGIIIPISELISLLVLGADRRIRSPQKTYAIIHLTPGCLNQAAMPPAPPNKTITRERLQATSDVANLTETSPRGGVTKVKCYRLSPTQKQKSPGPSNTENPGRLYYYSWA